MRNLLKTADSVRIGTRTDSPTPVPSPSHPQMSDESPVPSSGDVVDGGDRAGSSGAEGGYHVGDGVGVDRDGGEGGEGGDGVDATAGDGALRVHTAPAALLAIDDDGIRFFAAFARIASVTHRNCAFNSNQSKCAMIAVCRCDRVATIDNRASSVIRGSAALAHPQLRFRRDLPEAATAGTDCA